MVCIRNSLYNPRAEAALVGAKAVGVLRDELEDADPILQFDFLCLTDSPEQLYDFVGQVVVEGLELE